VRVTTTYRQSTKTVIGFTVAMLLALLGVGYGVASERGVDDRDVAITLGLFVGLIGLMILRFARTATIASPDALVARRFFWTRRASWSRVQAIVVETAITLREQEEHERAVVYLDNRRRLTLPGVTDQNLDALPEAAEALRRLWIAGRGPTWQPMEDIQRAAGHRARRPSALVLVVRWLKIGIGVMAGVWIVLILLRALPPEELRLPIALGTAGVIAVVGLLVEGIRGKSLPTTSAQTPDGAPPPNQPAR